MNSRFLMVAVVCLAVLASACAEETIQELLPDIEELVRQLDAETYELRKSATDQLVQVGAAAVKPLQAVVLYPGSNLEVQMRALEVLERLALDKPDKSRSAARQALELIIQQAESKRLQRATRRVVADVARQDARIAMQQLLALGMTFGTERENLFPFAQFDAQQMFHIGEDWAGTAEDLKKLQHLPQLRVLKLRGPQITDAYLQQAAHVTTMQFLHLNHAAITSKGLSQLTKSPNLRRLRVLNTKLDPSAVDTLAQLKVGQLQLVGTRLRASDGELLAQRMPFCEVEVRNGAFLGVGGTQGWQGLPGCELNTISPGSAAARAGLRNGDRIVKYDGRQVADFDDLRAQIGNNFPGDKVNVEIVRDGGHKTVAVTLGEMED